MHGARDRSHIQQSSLVGVFGLGLGLALFNSYELDGLLISVALVSLASGIISLWSP